MQKSLLLLVFVVVFAGCSVMAENPVVVIQTNHGEIIVELDQENAPVTVQNFLEYVDAGFYENTIFHRVIVDFMIQGGGFTPDGMQKQTNPPIALESQTGLSNDRGTIAMARTSVPDSATAQFFINHADNDFLNYAPNNPGYAVFGRVIEGMDVVDEIAQVQTGSSPMPDWPVEDVIITSVSRR
ncbi:MAG: peptidylprolyl isomerase [Candidatus Woesearchaeota archaeon]